MADLLNPLIGAWMLVSVETQLSDGQVIRAFGDSPKGIIVYTSSGHMTAQLSNPDRIKVASNDQLKATEEEIRSSYERYVAYHGTYELNTKNQTVIHNVEGSMFLNWVGGAQERTYTLEGDRVTLSTPVLEIGDMGNTRTVLTWEKLD